jgi:hypothetical protein
LNVPSTALEGICPEYVSSAVAVLTCAPPMICSSSF